MDPLSGQDVIRADPLARRRALVAFGAILAAGAGAVTWGLPAAAAYLKQLPAADALRLLQWLAAAAFLPMVPFGYFTWRHGQRILASGRFPPPGTRVIVDTPLLTGREARGRGRALRMLAVALAAFGAAGAVVFPVLIARLATNG
jgi:hypothetical protein